MKNIYVLGDSFSAGTELGDYLYPTWPGHTGVGKDIEAYNKWWSTDPSSLIDSKLVQQKEIELSWPSRLAQITNSTVLNSSAARSGPAHWINQLILDLSKASQTYNIAFFQFTSLDRITCYDNLNSNILPRHVFAGSHEYSEQQYFKYAKILESNLGSYYKFICAVAAVKYICQATNIQPVFISTHDFKAQTKIYLNSREVDYYPEISSVAKPLETTLQSMETLASHSSNLQGELPGGHFNADTQQRFAEYLANKYF